VARVFGARYRSEVAGLVLIEPVHEDRETRMPAAYRLAQAKRKKFLALLARASRWRILELFAKFAAPKAMSNSTRKIYGRLFTAPRSIATALKEIEAMPESDRQVRESPDVGNVPLIALRAGLSYSGVDEKFYPGNAPLGELRKVSADLLNEVSLRSKRGQLRVASNSGHMMLFEDPQFVVRAVRDMLDDE
jgi:pimeloyl-ACP methyl ester carboxylesterase